MNSESNPKTDDSGISNIVSELLNHIDSKDSFEFISDLLLTSLNIYQKKFSIENTTLINEKEFGEPERLEVINKLPELGKITTEYLTISNEIHSVLSNCPNLDKNQKLDYCNSQRYFMKRYMQDVIAKLELEK